MAEFFVRHSLNQHKAVKFNIGMREYVTPDSEGESLWMLEIGTTTPAADGSAIRPKYINGVEESNIDLEIEKAVGELCSLIDWTVLEQDNMPPQMDYFRPQGADTPQDSVIQFSVSELLPSAGIDLSDMKVTFNNGTVDFDITSEVTEEGDPYNYVLRWFPPIKDG